MAVPRAAQPFTAQTAGGQKSRTSKQTKNGTSLRIDSSEAPQPVAESGLNLAAHSRAVLATRTSGI